MNQNLELGFSFVQSTAAHHHQSCRWADGEVFHGSHLVQFSSVQFSQQDSPLKIISLETASSRPLDPPYMPRH